MFGDTKCSVRYKTHRPLAALVLWRHVVRILCTFAELSKQWKVLAGCRFCAAHSASPSNPYVRFCIITARVFVHRNIFHIHPDTEHPHCLPRPKLTYPNSHLASLLSATTVDRSQPQFGWNKSCLPVSPSLLSRQNLAAWSLTDLNTYTSRHIGPI